MRPISRCKGWASGHCGVNSNGRVNVSIWGVCACGWHKECVSQKRCRKLFADGGENGADRTLSELMGKPLPRAWRHDRVWKNMNQWQVKTNTKGKFEREWFEKCKPVVAEIHRR